MSIGDDTGIPTPDEMFLALTAGEKLKKDLSHLSDPVEEARLANHLSFCVEILQRGREHGVDISQATLDGVTDYLLMLGL